MKKRLLAALTATVLAAAVLGACSAAKESGQTSVEETAQAESTAVGTTAVESMSEEEKESSWILLSAEDSFQADAAWSGVQTFAESNGYASAVTLWKGEQTKEKLEETVKAEAAAGFSGIVCYGEAYSELILAAALEYPDTKFLLIGAAPETVLENMAAIDFKEEEAGFLAGYAAVGDGAASLGFIGKEYAPETIRFGFGFIQGADAAALEREREISVKYAYAKEADGDRGAASAGELAKEWFLSGTEVLFTDGKETLEAAAAAAGENGGKVIGAWMDCSELSPAVYASARVMIAEATEQALSALDAGENKGTAVRLGAAGDAVSLSFHSESLDEFSQGEYELLFEGLKAGDYTPAGDTGKDGKRLELSDLVLTNTDVRFLDSAE